ncbi:MAG TPA: hypothetical protein PKZ52_08475 [Cellvibrionaceae bacterium]|nr:hypothetical protein [Cellvibrionaceae bacterium]
MTNIAFPQNSSRRFFSFIYPLPPRLFIQFYFPLPSTNSATQFIFNFGALKNQQLGKPEVKNALRHFFNFSEEPTIKKIFLGFTHRKNHFFDIDLEFF